MFINGSGLFAGTRSDGLVRSKDFGRTWEKLNNGIPATDVPAIIGNDTMILAITTSRGIYKSLDNGDSWQIKAIDEGFPGTGYLFDGLVMDSVVIITGNNGIYRSVDQGEHWNPVEIETKFLPAT